MRYRWFEDEKYHTSDTKKYRMARGELTGIFICAVVFLYALTERDIPVMFITAAFIFYELRPMTSLLGEPMGSFLSNVLQSFSIVLFFGALFLLIL